MTDIMITTDPCFRVTYEPIRGVTPQCTVEREAPGQYRLTCIAELAEEVPIGDWQLRIIPAFEPDFFWTSHLTPDDDSVVDMHVYRTPALMLGNQDLCLCALPLTDGVQNGSNRLYMDLDARKPMMTFGVTTTELYEHVLYRRQGCAVLPAGEFRFSVILLVLEGTAIENPFRAVLHYFWQHYGREQSKTLIPYDRLQTYADRTYQWAFGSWEKVCWQEFTLHDTLVGAPQFIVTVQQSSNYNEPYSIREDCSIWNQAWFCSLRSAAGLYRYAVRTNRSDLLDKARMTKELALRFPQKDGLFDSVIAVPAMHVDIDGKTYRKPAPWSEHYFGNSNRNPQARDLASSPWHILDMSWTALYMLQWYEELEQDERLLEYVLRYADRLVELQDAKGYFPAWIEKSTRNILPELRQSPESAVSATLLLTLYRLTKRETFGAVALRTLDVLTEEVMPEGRWEDFETYWSCCGYGSGTLLGKKVERNGIYKQCSLSMFYLAQALLSAWELTQKDRYLIQGQRCLDEMLMLQSSFQPSYLPVPVVGGFGVMNCDAELNDARQSLFAELIIAYGKALNMPEYIQRGYAALAASFSMMYCPENPDMKAQWETRWPFFDERDYGFMMENYGHSGYADDHGVGIGEFTIYDWGCGAAAEAYLRIDAHYGAPEAEE